MLPSESSVSVNLDLWTRRRLRIRFTLIMKPEKSKFSRIRLSKYRKKPFTKRLLRSRSSKPLNALLKISLRCP